MFRDWIEARQRDGHNILAKQNAAERISSEIARHGRNLGIRRRVFKGDSGIWPHGLDMIRVQGEDDATNVATSGGNGGGQSHHGQHGGDRP